MDWKCRVCTFIGVLMASICCENAHALIHEYFGACDGSTAVALVSKESMLFISVSDEDNLIRLYEIGNSKSKDSIDLEDSKTLPPTFLELPDKGDEIDVEGAARIGQSNVVYWIGSHGTKKEAKPAPNRRRLFGLLISLEDGKKISISPQGATSYHTLVQDLSRLPAWKDLDALEAAKKETDAEGGLNIEGLAAYGNNGLLIAFRNPVKGGKSFILPIQEIDKLSQGQKPTLGDPIRLKLGDTGELGIRSLEYARERQSYLIVAGPYQKDKADAKFFLYEWPGPPSAEVRLLKRLQLDGRDFQPEALILFEGLSKKAYLLSDDGELLIPARDGGANPCKSKKVAPSEKRFRGSWIELE
jgi:hypothetical protein